jgi:hypothetical protein
MARVTFGGPTQRRQRTRILPSRPSPQKRRNWYEDPGQILGWVRLAEALAAPKGLIARGVRAAQRWQLEQDAEARKEAIEVDQQLNMLRQRASQGDAGAMHALDPMGGFDQDPAPSPEQRAQLMADYQGGMRPADPLFRTATDPGVKPMRPLPPLRGAEGQVLPRVAPTAPTAGAAPPLPSLWDQVTERIDALGPISRSDFQGINADERAGMQPEELLEKYGKGYENTLLRRAEAGERGAEATYVRLMGLTEPGQAPAQEAAPAPTPAPEAQAEQPRYRQFNMQQKEAAESKAKELDDYTAAMGLSTVNEVYEDFGKYAGAKGGRLDADDFADLWEQAKLMLERDPSYVDGLALDPVGTQRRLLRDTMAYFKFLNMGGDPAAAKRQRVKDERAEVELTRAKRKDAQERARAERKSRTGVRIVRDIPVGAPNWEDDLVQWGIWRDAGFDQTPGRSNVPSYLSHKDGGKYAAAANRAKQHLKDWLESPQGWDKPESQWSTWQREAFKDESKEINKYRTQVDARDRTAGEEPSYDQASDKFEWTEEGGRKRTGTLSDVLKGRILTETEAKSALKAGGLSDAQADAAIEEANKAKKSKTTQRTKNAWSVIQDFSVADLQGSKSDVKTRLDTGFFGRNKWDRLTDPATQRKIQEAINEILAAEEVENVPPKWINIANKIKALGIRGL